MRERTAGADWSGASQLLGLVSDAQPKPSPRPSDELLRAWHAASGTPLAFHEWCDPTVSDVADALGLGRAADMRRLDRLVVAFARGRAASDHGADEVADDLGAFARLAEGRCHPSVDLVALMAHGLAGWASERATRAACDGCVDPLTGLVTGAYLWERIGELHRQCRGLEIAPAKAFGALLLHLQLAEAPRPARTALRVAAARALESAFRGGETVAALRPELFVVVMPSEELSVGRSDAATALDSDARLHDLVMSLAVTPFGDDPRATWHNLGGGNPPWAPRGGT